MADAPLDRAHARNPLDGWADYRQGDRFGSWALLDISSGGLCACGDLAGLDLGAGLDVELRSSKGRLPIQLRLVWQRYDSTGVSVHGWEFTQAVPDIREFVATLSRTPPGMSA